MILLMTESASPLLSFWVKFLSSKVGARSKPMGISAILVALYLRPHVKHAPQMNAQHVAANTFGDYTNEMLHRQRPLCLYL
jgi:hypothetical protein